MNRTAFIVDGFNLYHSIREAHQDNPALTTKWLNLSGLCTSFLPLISKDARLEGVYYFTAFAFHLNDPAVIERHKDYIKCLEDTGVQVSLSRFKEKQITCDFCNRVFIRHEEKETDVAVASKLLELVYTDCCDTVVLLTGDTDLAPAVKLTKQARPDKKVIFAFPYGRKNTQLSQIAPGSFKIKAQTYAKHQFNNPYTLKDGTLVNKPLTW
jgi:uncharacterized LabA/DUF88 family protein